MFFKKKAKPIAEEIATIIGGASFGYANFHTKGITDASPHILFESMASAMVGVISFYCLKSVDASTGGFLFASMGWPLAQAWAHQYYPDNATDEADGFMQRLVENAQEYGYLDAVAAVDEQNELLVEPETIFGAWYQQMADLHKGSPHAIELSKATFMSTLTRMCKTPGFQHIRTGNIRIG